MKREERRVAGNLIPSGDFVALSKRKISAETCARFNYSVGQLGGLPVHVAEYRDDSGLVVAQHVRLPNKDFKWFGTAKGVQLFGQHLWNGGKIVVVTEGELDCLSIAEVQGCKWPVVSIPSGASGAARAVRDNLSWLETYTKVVFCFDEDEPGKKAAKECSLLLTPGKAFITHLPLKDASDMLQGGRVEELQRCLWNAAPYRPDGLLDAMTLEEELLKPLPVGYPIPYHELNEKLQGVRKGELLLFTAGSGVGKSTIVHEIGYALLQQGLRLGVMALEENKQRTLLRYVSLEMNKPLHLVKDELNPADIKEAFRSVVRVGEDGISNLFLYDHFGSSDIDTLLGKIRYMAVGLAVDFVILDHLSIVVSGSDEASADERRALDVLMTKLRSLVEETGIGVIAISHLRRPQEGAYTEGKQVSLSALRGSAALEQLSDAVVALERDQQAQGAEGDISTIRVLKNRPIGLLGEAGKVRYVHATGRLEGWSQFETEGSPVPPKKPRARSKPSSKRDSELDF